MCADRQVDLRKGVGATLDVSDRGTALTGYYVCRARQWQATPGVFLLTKSVTSGDNICQAGFVSGTGKHRFHGTLSLSESAPPAESHVGASQIGTRLAGL
jgi:hypothetical protein